MLVTWYRIMMSTKQTICAPALQPLAQDVCILWAVQGGGGGLRALRCFCVLRSLLIPTEGAFQPFTENSDCGHIRASPRPCLAVVR